jgi:hypothetical protein
MNPKNFITMHVEDKNGDWNWPVLCSDHIDVYLENCPDYSRSHINVLSIPDSNSITNDPINELINVQLSKDSASSEKVNSAQKESVVYQVSRHIILIITVCFKSFILLVILSIFIMLYIFSFIFSYAIRRKRISLKLSQIRILPHRQHHM